MLDVFSQAMLSTTCIPRGGSCLEVGAGMGSMAHWLAEQVGPDGYVLATDVVAPRIAAGRNVEVRVHDIEIDPMPAMAFDLIHARLVLGQLACGEEVVHKLATSLAPGGTLALSDWEFHRGVRCRESRADNAGELFDAFNGAIRTILRDDGVPLNWPSRVPFVMRDAGLTVTFSSVDEARRRGGKSFCKLLLYHTELLGDRLLDAGMRASDLQALRQVLLDPTLLVSAYPLVAVTAFRTA